MSSILLQLSGGQKTYGPKELFSNAQFSVNEGEHIGLIGPNGAGKSTLFRILVGEEDLDEGEIITTKGLRLGYLKQEDDFDVSKSLEALLEEGCTLPIWDLKSLGRGLGLTESDFARPLGDFSGGYRMRFKLLHLLGQEPQLLLLDEPTNYLDLESLIVLEKFLIELKGAFILISHDREFLRLTTDHILEIEQGDFTKFNGSLDDYFEYKAAIDEIQRKKAANIEAKKAQMQKFVDRFRAKATKARQAQSRLKQLGKMESVDIKSLPVRARIQLPEPTRTGKEILNTKSLTMGYGEKMVLRDVQLRILRGDHIGVVGVNGAGKSTLLKTLSGQLTPLSGDFEWGHNVKIGYYAQHVPEALDPNQSVEEALFALAHSDVNLQDVRDMAGALLFSDDDRNKKIKILSGGEKSRVALGQILLQRPPCLLLDEPTNHLDFETVEALTLALKGYKGSLIIVSHDRSFIGRIAHKILEIRDGQAEIYPGTYDEYVWSLQKGAWSDKSETTPSRPAGTTTKKRVNNVNRKQLNQSLRAKKAEIRKVEERIDQLNKEISELTQSLMQLHGPEVATAKKELEQKESEKQSFELTWMITQEELEQLEAQIN